MLSEELDEVEDEEGGEIDEETLLLFAVEI